MFPTRVSAGIARFGQHLLTLWRTGFTMARRGLLTPARPDRIFGQLRSLSTWGLSLAGGYVSAAKRSPHKTAVIDQDGELSFAELDTATDRLAQALRSTCGPQLRVALLCRNHRGLVKTLLACAKAGADAVLFNTGLSPTQVSQALHDHEVTVLVCDKEFLPQVPGSVTTVVADGHGHGSLDQLIASATRQRPRPPTKAGRTIVLTSGTTGSPKGASRPEPALRSLTALLSRIPLKVGDRIHIAAPMFHTWGYAALQLAMALRATVVLHPRFDPEQLLRSVQDDKATAVIAVPIMLQRILDLPVQQRTGYDTSHLRVVATSGSAYPGDLAVNFMDAFGDVLYNLYGTTEVSWAAIATPADLRRSPTTCGRPPHGTKLLLLDPQGHHVAQGQRGRIFVGNEMLFEGYSDGSQRSTFDGAMDSGDIGHRDETGLLFVDGRADDMIVSGGENVYPSQVEDLLAKLPQVSEVAVIGVDDAQFGQRLAAHVVVSRGHQLDTETVRDHVRRHLARFSVPREVHFHDQLPRNATGKVVPQLLR